MPETQQEWLTRQIRSVLRRQSEGEHGKAIVPTGEIATHLASAWPSSPQGLAVKQVMKALEPFIAVLSINEQLQLSDTLPLRECIPGVWPTLGELRTLIAAARKAGLA